MLEHSIAEQSRALALPRPAHVAKVERGRIAVRGSCGQPPSPGTPPTAHLRGNESTNQ